ncbi:hypothetical protein GGR56DRAFT_482621 [Xylariaceae sp. FL0804]|nr:hypothetical protein GGR56DRAFT_482621 [Xylariaceae sp. FL0804]
MELDWEGPVLPPPEGTVSNFANPPNQNALAHSVLGLCLAVSTVTHGGWLHFTGTFVHSWDVRLRDLGPINYETLIASNLYSATLLFTKTAILKQCLDIFVPKGTRNSFFWAAWAIILFSAGYYVSGIIALNLAYIPIQALWDITVKGRCIKVKVLDTSGAAINLVSDIGILVLPQRTIWRLNMSARNKLGVSFLFAIVVFCGRISS